MTQPPAGYPCANHPVHLTQQVCARCGRPFCDACLTELLGQPVCGWCRDQHIAAMQGLRGSANPATVVLLARILDGLGLLFGGGGAVFMAGYSGLIFSAAAAGRNGPPSSAVAPVFGGFLVAAGIVLVVAAAIYLPPLLLLGPGRRGMWNWQLAACIASTLGGWLLGLPGMLLSAAGAVLLVFWLQPSVRSYLEGSP